MYESIDFGLTLKSIFSSSRYQLKMTAVRKKKKKSYITILIKFYWGTIESKNRMRRRTYSREKRKEHYKKKRSSCTKTSKCPSHSEICNYHFLGFNG
jgi:hypothetical protein